MNPIAKVVDKIVNPPRVSDPDRLRAAVSGKTVLVTGASHGLGEATARKLGAAGAIVLLVARSADRLTALEASINAGGGRAAAYPADLDRPDSGRRTGEGAHRKPWPDGRRRQQRRQVHPAIAASAVRPAAGFRAHDRRQLPRPRPVAARAASRDEAPRQRAHREHFDDRLRTAPGPRWGTYLASKSAFDVWLRSVEPELRADGVHVTSVYMTLVHTPMSDPTPILRRMPGLSAEQAADIVAKAIIDRPGRVQPWWVWPIEISSMLLPGPLGVGMGLMYRFSTDSPSARGTRQ